LALNSIRSSSMGPPGPQKSGHFYFAQTGHSHFAATLEFDALTCLMAQHKIRVHA